MTNQVPISTEFIKLDQFLKFAGAAPTGGDAKNLILSGLVAVNGIPCQMRGKKLHPGDTVTARGTDYEVVSGGNHPN